MEDEPQLDPADFVLNDQRHAQAAAVKSLDDSPDDAARALELSDATGVPSALVHSNLENFETQHKAALTQQLLNNNQYLRQYVASHPMAPKISNDDYGQLDAASQATQKLGEDSIMGKSLKAFKEGYNFEDQQKQFLKMMSDPVLGGLTSNPAIVGGLAALHLCSLPYWPHLRWCSRHWRTLHQAHWGRGLGTPPHPRPSSPGPSLNGWRDG